MSEIGIPYAEHVAEGRTVYAICPVCKARVRLTGRKDQESASIRRYQEHYADLHAVTWEQLKALRYFKDSAGRAWKRLLSEAWARCSIPGEYQENENSEALLIRVRNERGADWLAKVRLEDLRPADAPTYRAWIKREGQDAPAQGDVIYEGRLQGNLIGELPIGARPLPAGQCGTLDRKDGGDAFERALFGSPSGRVYVVERERARAQG